MAKAGGIEIIEEDSGPKKRKDRSKDCPICGAPNGLQKCEKCGWGIEDDLEPIFGMDADPVTTLLDARMSFVSIRKEVRELKERNRLLMENNQKFAELIELICQQARRFLCRRVGDRPDRAFVVAAPILQSLEVPVGLVQTPPDLFGMIIAGSRNCLGESKMCLGHMKPHLHCRVQMPTVLPSRVPAVVKAIGHQPGQRQSDENDQTETED